MKCIRIFSGGSYRPAPEKDYSPRIIGNGIVSVRQSKTGRGSSLRIFVNTKKNTCSAESCLSKYSTLNKDQLEKPWCEHLKEGISATSNAQCVNICLESLSDLNIDKEIKDDLLSLSKDGILKTYIVNSKTTAVPAVLANSDFELVHVKDGACPLKGCKRLNNPHTLAKRNSKLCFHSLLSFKWLPNSVKKEQSQSQPKADHRKTVMKLIQEVNEHFPSLSENNLKNELPLNKGFVDELRYFCMMLVFFEICFQDCRRY